jgi:hypothetical protein
MGLAFTLPDMTTGVAGFLVPRTPGFAPRGDRIMPLKALLATVIACFTLLLASGCGCEGGDAGGSRITRRNFDKIRVGMSHQEVTEILGEPTAKGPMLPSRASFWSWTEGEKEILVCMDETAHVNGLGNRTVKYAFNLE